MREDNRDQSEARKLMTSQEGRAKVYFGKNQDISGLLQLIGSMRFPEHLKYTCELLY